MEKVKESKSQPKTVGIDSDIPSAPTLEDFYFDPGIRREDSPSFEDPLGVVQFSAPVLTEDIQHLNISDQGSKSIVSAL